MLKRTLPSRAQTLLGAAVITGAAFAACAAAWSAQPTRLVVTTQPAPESQTLAAQTHRLVKTAHGALAPVEVASVELDGAPTLSDDPNGLTNEQAETDHNSDLDNDSEHVRIEENLELFSEQEQREIRARGALTAAQQARLDAFVHQHVDAAMQRANMAWRREVQESVRIAAREAARHAETARRYENFHMSRELDAEAEALSRAVTRLATQEIELAREGRDNAALDAARAEVRQHADRIRELAERERAVRTDDQGDDHSNGDSDRDGDRSDQN